MSIEPVSLGASNPMTGLLWAELLRPKGNNETKGTTLFDVIQSNNGVSMNNPVNDIFSIINQPVQFSIDEHERAGFLQAVFLQYPNKVVQELGKSIVSPDDSNDIKAQKLQRWVYNNITYRLDIDVWGVEEMWQPPVITIQKKTGDCEDMSLLLHSLMLNVGIPSTRIRTYGGYVDDNAGTSGGHAWTAYLRESDNEWVILDTAFYPDLSPVSSMPLMKDSEIYEKDYFFMTLTETVSTPYTDRIHDPNILPVYSRKGNLRYDLQRQPGMWLNAFA